MEIVYKSEKIKKQCTSVKTAKKLFGGDERLAMKLLSTIQSLEQAETIKDIIVLPTYHFHSLKDKGRKNLEGYYAIDVGTRKQPWRIIMQPLNDRKEPFASSTIDQIAGIVRIVEISEVSKHYE